MASRPLGFYSAIACHLVIGGMTAICAYHCISVGQGGYRANTTAIYNFPGPWGWAFDAGIVAVVGTLVGLGFSIFSHFAKRLTWLGVILNLLLLPAFMGYFRVLSGVMGIDFD